jgi:hypothetical protein
MNEVLKLGRTHKLSIPLSIRLIRQNGETFFTVRMRNMGLWKLSNY